MKHLRFWWLVVFGWVLVGCAGGDEITVTPPIAEMVATEPVEMTTNTPLPPPEVSAVTNTPLAQPPTKTPTTDGDEPTAEPAEMPATEIPEPATPLPIPKPISSISLSLVADGFTRPVYLTHAFDDRLFVVEQPGVIQIIGQTNPFLNITNRVGSDGNEQGLLSAAFHPDYVNNGRFFVYYTDKRGVATISEFAVSNDPNVAIAESEKVLLAVSQPFQNHNGGQLQFGPDGYLYVGLGDGGSQGDPEGNGQNAGTLLGTILRIDINNTDLYAIPPDNPFVGNDNARNEIWAMGLRNPWRFSFDKLTGDLFIADVGQTSFEEVSFQPATSDGGENYGWNQVEGFACYTENCNLNNFTTPITVYGRDEGCSVTGGYVYRGSDYPDLFGHYFYSDFCLGTIWSLLNQNGTWSKTVLFDSPYNVSSFGEDANGELYVLDLNGGIYRLES